MVAVRQRELADVARHGDRQLAARVHDAGEHVGDRVRPGIARHPREQDRGAVLGRPRQRQRAAADDDEHDRRAGRDHGLEQLLLPAEEPEPGPIAELAGRRVVGQPRSLAEHDDGDVGVAGERHGRRELLVGPGRDAGPAGVDDLGARQRGAQGVDDRPSPGQLVARLEDLAVADDAERIDARAHLAERLHVDQVAVVAEQVAGAVGDRAR